jgi:capsular exopolysaccharide synthesis family protein
MELKMNRRKNASFPVNAKNNLHQNLGFTATEQYKLLRTNLNFTLPENVKCPIIGVTSSMRGEGKSTTSINLSYVLAENGKKVLLIDGDLRIPSIAKKMDIAGSPGLTNLLMHPESYRIKDFQSSIRDNWFILPAGDIPPNPSELLGSRRMEGLLKAFTDWFDNLV